MLKKLDFRAKTTLLITAIFLLTFFIFRLLLLITYNASFTALSAGEIISAFIQGFRFDFAMFATFALPPLILFNIPLNFKWWAKIWLNLILIVFIVFLTALIADFVYFDYVQKHMAEELLVLGNDVWFIVEFAFKEMLLPLIIFILVIAAAFIALNKLTNKFFNVKRQYEILRFVILAIVLVLGLRGKIFDLGKPLGIADVYQYTSSTTQANLALNGVFTSYHTLRKGYIPMENNIPFDEALATVKPLIAGRKTFFPDEQNYPIMQQIKPEYKFNNYNVFVILLEGWNPAYVDGLTDKNEKKFGVTPNLDNIIKDAVVMQNAYGSGLRSIMGFASAFAGVPTVPSLPMFGYGLELSSMSAIGRDLSKQDYYTIFAQASKRDSYRLCALASGVLGMQGSYGREDIPELLDYKEKAAFGYDYDALMFTADKVKDKNNFLAFTFMATTHDPFIVTLEEFEKYPRDSWENMFLNSVYYSDYSIGKLIEKAKQDGWFDNTIFVIMSDHNSGPLKRSDVKNEYKIPFVIYAPKILKPQKISYTVSQSDLIPTIYDLLNIPAPYSAMGKSIFDGPKDRAVFVTAGIAMGLINDDGAMLHNGKNRLETQPSSPDYDADKAEKELLSIEKVTTTLMRTNKWFKQD
ncbi:phosphoglycerol transferase MdoB-like AlkP superfamily enzyme [Elusimicrobium posterum]|uniref:LTA synthase family protein n=1 Tax=Elusimicrobium posterum TaxID=3116653 RepID=UPI003C73304D